MFVNGCGNDICTPPLYLVNVSDFDRSNCVVSEWFDFDDIWQGDLNIESCSNMAPIYI